MSEAINDPRDVAFDREYERLAKLGACDSPGGMEHERVKAEWVEAGRPADIEKYIRWRANVGPMEAS